MRLLLIFLLLLVSLLYFASQTSVAASQSFNVSIRESSNFSASSSRSFPPGPAALASPDLFDRSKSNDKHSSPQSPYRFGNTSPQNSKLFQGQLQLYF
jgi:hypothetical protein